jgi:predicted secreted protein
MLRRMLLATILAPMLFVAGNAEAQDQAPTPPAPAGQTILNISATEHAQVPQDLLVASLSIEKQGSDPRAVQNTINTLMQQALGKARAAPDVQASTGQYYVYPVDPDTQQNVARGAKGPKLWRGTQSLQLKSTKSDALLPLAGNLQDIGLIMNDLSYQISPQKEEDARDALLEAALTKLKSKAERAAKILGKSQADFAEINVDTNFSNPGPIRPMMMMAAVRAAPMAAPSAAPDTTDIDLTVTAKAILKP